MMSYLLLFTLILNCDMLTANDVVVRINPSPASGACTERQNSDVPQTNARENDRIEFHQIKVAGHISPQCFMFAVANALKAYPMADHPSHEKILDMCISAAEKSSQENTFRRLLHWALSSFQGLTGWQLKREPNSDLLRWNPSDVADEVFVCNNLEEDCRNHSRRGMADLFGLERDKQLKLATFLKKLREPNSKERVVGSFILMSNNQRTKQGESHWVRVTIVNEHGNFSCKVSDSQGYNRSDDGRILHLILNITGREHLVTGPLSEIANRKALFDYQHELHSCPRPKTKLGRPATLVATMVGVMIIGYVLHVLYQKLTATPKNPYDLVYA